MKNTTVEEYLAPFFKIAFLEYIKSSSTNLLQANYKGKPSTNHWMPYYGSFFHYRKIELKKR